MKSVDVVFSPSNRRIKTVDGASILDAAPDADVAIRAYCGGNRIWGKCPVIVHHRNVTTELSDTEKGQLSLHELRSGYRLACQTIPKQDIRVMIPKESRIGERRILAHGMEKRTTLNPLVKKFHVKMRKPTLSDSTPDFDRLLSALPSACKTEGLTIE